MDIKNNINRVYSRVVPICNKKSVHFLGVIGFGFFVNDVSQEVQGRSLAIRISPYFVLLGLLFLIACWELFKHIVCPDPQTPPIHQQVRYPDRLQFQRFIEMEEEIREYSHDLGFIQPDIFPLDNQMSSSTVGGTGRPMNIFRRRVRINREVNVIYEIEEVQSDHLVLTIRDGDGDLTPVRRSFSPQVVLHGSKLFFRSSSNCSASQLVESLRLAYRLDKDCTLQLGSRAIMKYTGAGPRLWRLRTDCTPIMIDLRCSRTLWNHFNGSGVLWIIKGFNMQDAVVKVSTGEKSEYLHILQQDKAEDGFDVIICEESLFIRESAPLFRQKPYIFAERKIEGERYRFVLRSQAKNIRTPYWISVVDAFMPSPWKVVLLIGLLWAGNLAKKSSEPTRNALFVYSLFSCIHYFVGLDFRGLSRQWPLPFGEHTTVQTASHLTFHAADVPETAPIQSGGDHALTPETSSPQTLFDDATSVDSSVTTPEDANTPHCPQTLDLDDGDFTGGAGPSRVDANPTHNLVVQDVWKLSTEEELRRVESQWKRLSSEELALRAQKKMRMQLKDKRKDILVFLSLNIGLWTELWDEEMLKTLFAIVDNGSGMDPIDKQQASRAILAIVSKHSLARVRIASLEFREDFRSLIDFLRDDQESSKVLVSLLSFFSMEGFRDGQDAIVDCSGVEALLGIMEDPRSSRKERLAAVVVLANLAENSKARQQYIHEVNFINRAVQCILTYRRLPVRVALIRALVTVMDAEAGAATLVRKADGLRAFASVLEASNEEIASVAVTKLVEQGLDEAKKSLGNDRLFSLLWKCLGLARNEVIVLDAICAILEEDFSLFATLED